MRFIWPLDSHVISRDFYYRGSLYIGGQHMAIDIPANLDTVVKAVATGKVIAAGFGDINGNYVSIGHNDGWRTKYRHLMGPAFVNAGDAVSQGQVIGRVGSTGWSTGPHLHFDLWNLSKQSPEAIYKTGIWAHDPEVYLGQEDEMNEADEAKVQKMIEAAFIKQNTSKWRLKQIADLLPNINKHLRGIVLGIIKKELETAGVSYTDAQAVKAVKDALA